MMKAALGYYRDQKKQGTEPAVNSSAAGSLLVRRRRTRTTGAELSPGEMSLWRLFKNGQVGALIAQHAPAVR